MMQYYATKKLQTKHNEETKYEYNQRMKDYQIYYASIRIVHELTHVVDEDEYPDQSSTEEEIRAWQNENDFYEFLKEKYGYEDRLMEMRYKQISEKGYRDSIRSTPYYRKFPVDRPGGDSGGS